MMTWLKPWIPLEAERKTLLEQQLQRELPAGHALSGATAEAVGESEASDDVLFRLSGPTSAYAVVHLTWASRSPDARWPSTHLYRDWKDFAERRMREDNFGYA